MPTPHGSFPDEPGPAVVDTLRRAYSDAVLAGDEAAAGLAVRAALRLGLTAGQIDVELITPALWRVGELWERGEISVADEHLATEISMRVLVLQHEHTRIARRRPARRVLLAALEAERHVVGLRMAADLLSDAGYDARFLGADVPLAALRQSAARHTPAVVCLTTTMPGGEPALWRAVEQLEGTSVLVGGSGLAEDFPERPQVAACRLVSDVVGAVDALVAAARLN